MPAAPPPPPSQGAQSGERIAKLLARAGVASRREVERMIEEGRVALNGATLTTPATVLRSLDGVTVDGNPVAGAEPARLFLYHKPVGLLVTERDPRGRPTIYDRLPIAPRGDLPRVIPVGRLDLATEGLLLLTTDGGLKRQLELPATGVERTYRARTYGRVSQAQLEDLIDGVEIEGIRYGRIDANQERRTGANAWIELTLTEGKNREVRRVLEHLGLQVGRLIRTRYGPFVLGDLPPGAIGEVRAHDVESFRANPTRLELPQPARGGSVAPQKLWRSETPRRAPTPRPSHPSAAPPPLPSPTGRGREQRVALRKGESEGERNRQPAAPPRAKGPSLGRGSARPRRPDAPAPTGEIANPNRAQRAATHRRNTGRDEPPATPRPPKPVRGKGWAKAKPKPGPRGRPQKPRR